MKFYVYELRDEAGRVFYVGKGSGQRRHVHVVKALRGERSKKAAKIRSILARGGSVVSVVVFETDDEGAAFREEIRLIARYGRGALTNLTDGGDGNANPPAEVREKIAAARRGIIVGPETRARQRLAKLGRPRTQETRAKIGAYQKGSAHPWARRVALANLAGGMTFASRRHTPEAIAKMRAAKLGHVVTDETRRRISEAKKRRPINTGT